MRTTATVSRHYLARTAQRRWLATSVPSGDGPHYYVQRSRFKWRHPLRRRYAVVRVLVQPIPVA